MSSAENIIVVDFQGHDLQVVPDPDPARRYWAVPKPFFDSVGVPWPSVFKRLKRLESKGKAGISMMEIPTDGGIQSTTVIDRRTLVRLVMGVDTRKLGNAKARKIVEEFQDGGYEVVDEAIDNDKRVAEPFRALVDMAANGQRPEPAPIAAPPLEWKLMQQRRMQGEFLLKIAKQFTGQARDALMRRAAESALGEKLPELLPQVTPGMFPDDFVNRGYAKNVQRVGRIVSELGIRGDDRYCISVLGDRNNGEGQCVRYCYNDDGRDLIIEGLRDRGWLEGGAA